MEIVGRIKTVLPIVSGTSQRGPWSKATIIIEYQSGSYTNLLALENMAKAEEFAALPVGAEFRFWFDASSREYQGRYYTQCNCFNWQPAAQQPAAPQGYAPAAPQGYAPAAPQGYAPQPAPGYPQPPQGYAPQAPAYAAPADGDMPY